MSRVAATSSTLLLPQSGARVANRAGVQVAAAVLALLLPGASTTTAAPIFADVIGCVGLTCIVEPIGGPVDLDPASFTLEVEWSSTLQYLDLEDRGLMRLTFEYTGEHEGTEHFSNITLLDPSGNPIPSLIGAFDDANPVAGILTATFDIFGPEALLGGFRLGPSDGSGVDTLRWTRATIFPSELVEVPEPSALLLLSAGLGMAAMRRRLKARHRLENSSVIVAHLASPGVRKSTPATGRGASCRVRV
jgi:hypothetical protein